MSPFHRRPPYKVFTHFLEEKVINDLLKEAESRSDEFRPMTVDNETVNTNIRRSLGIRHFGSGEAALKNRLSDLVPQLIAQLRVTPFDLAHIEAELVAHGDGAFYRQHIDTFTGPQSHSRQRMLSGVFYFHTKPRAFSGGALRLHDFAFSADGLSYVDIEPERNTLVIFPSWAPHEVLPITCPSKKFMDSRFAVNMWLHRETPK